MEKRQIAKIASPAGPDILEISSLKNEQKRPASSSPQRAIPRRPDFYGINPCARTGAVTASVSDASLWLTSPRSRPTRPTRAWLQQRMRKRTARVAHSTCSHARAGRVDTRLCFAGALRPTRPTRARLVRRGPV
jgi:hypothetical protein